MAANTRDIHFSDEVEPKDILSDEKSEKASEILIEGIQSGMTPARIINKLHEEIEFSDMEWSVLMMACGLMFQEGN